MLRYIKRMLIGKPLKTLDEGGQNLNRLKALALLSPDALSSVAYGPGQITIALATVSSLTLWLQIPIAILVLVLLAAITLSYRQIIHAYPGGGGAYRVSSENWGTKAGLVAGGSLLVDYMLTVAVSVSSGIDAITAAIPNLRPYSIEMAIMIVVFLMAINLRGIRESATVLMVPVYLFIVTLAIMLVYGMYNVATGQVAYMATAHIGQSAKGISVILFLKAFSSGSSSLTGVEAISNSVPNFEAPKAKNAARTLSIMSIVLGFFFAAITFLTYYYGILPKSNTTILAQITEKTFGGVGIGFYIIQLSTALILAVAANTGFSAFPQLAFNLAKDKFMPHSYMDKGDRLGYSNGIISLALGAIILIIIFNGSVEALIPLYAVGVFTPFTLSQSGMIIHWKRVKGPHWKLKSIVNFIGALISGILVITLFWLHFSFVWPYVFLMIGMVMLFYKVNNHYKSVAQQLSVKSNENFVRHHYEGATVIILVSNLTNITAQSVDYAKSIGDLVLAMHVSLDYNPEKENKLKMDFKREFPSIRYIDIHSTYRSITEPTIKFVDEISKSAKDRNHSLTILIPQFIPKKSWQNALHNQSSLRLRTALSSRDVTVATYYHNLLK